MHRKVPLLKQDSLFRRIFDSNIIGLLFSDFSGNILAANEAFLGIIGYTADDIENGTLNWKAITPPEQLQSSEAALEEVRKVGVCIPFEKEYVTKDGRLVPVLLGAARIDGEKGNQIVTYVLDITNRKILEENMASVQERLEQRVQERTKDLVQTYSFLDSLIENIPNMIFVKDAKDLRFVRFNKAGESLLGMTRDQLIGKNDYDFFPAEEADFFRNRDLDVLSGKTVVDIPEETISTKQGQRILHTKKIPIFDTDGEARYLLGISEDITGQKEADNERIRLAQEQAARVEAERSADRFKLLAEASAVLGSSLDFEVTLKNLTGIAVPRIAEWCAIHLKQPDGELKTLAIAHKDPEKVKWGWELHEKYPASPDAAHGIYAVLRTGVSEWLPQVTDEMIERSAVSEEHLKLARSIGFSSYICSPIRARGEVLGTLTLMTTTESGRTYSETDLHFAEELAERTGYAIDNARLYKEAQYLNRVKDEFLATLSHELRTPLNVIQGYADLLLLDGERMGEEERRIACQAIYRNAQNQTQIIGDLLDVSSIITGKINFRPERISPASIAEAVMENAAPMAESRRVRLSLDTSRAPKTISADPTRLQQILWNLVSNAIKFTSSDGLVHIRIFEDDSCCVIEVVDTGTGIEDSFLPFVFDRFRQEDSGTTRRFGGLGLGLSIVRHLTELHGGTVQAESPGKGKGSTFTVRLPLVVHLRENARGPLKGAPTRAPESDGVRLDGVKVLVLEDSEDNRELVKRYLAHAGAEVVEAENASHARELLGQEHPDIIVSDIGLPDEDGVSFIKKFRKSEHGTFTPAIALTAYVLEDEQRQMLNAGFQSHVSKPISRQDLLRKIADLTRRR